jgi:hypothetical protein
MMLWHRVQVSDQLRRSVCNGWKADIASRPKSLQHRTMRTMLCAFLIVFALTGCQKHSAPAPRSCVPALPGWLTAEPRRGDLFVANVVSLAGHGVLWNGSPVNEQVLVQYARQLAPRSPVPFLVLDPGPSPDCSFARHVRDVLDQNYPCHEGKCGQGPTSNFMPSRNGPRSGTKH